MGRGMAAEVLAPAVRLDQDGAEAGLEASLDRAAREAAATARSRRLLSEDPFDAVPFLYPRPSGNSLTLRLDGISARRPRRRCCDIVPTVNRRRWCPLAERTAVSNVSQNGLAELSVGAGTRRRR